MHIRARQHGADGYACVFRTIVTDRFGIVAAEFGNVTGHPKFLSYPVAGMSGCGDFGGISAG